MSSIQPVFHVHFPALLEQPPVDRVRKRGLVYPKLAQSKGSGDRMHSPDLFWGSRRVSAAPSGPGPRGTAVPRGMIHLLSKSPLQPAAADAQAQARTPALTILTRTCAERLVRSPSSEYASLPLLGFVGVGGPLAAIEVDGGLFFVPISPRFISTPISSYSGTTSTSSGRDSEKSSVTFGVGI